MKTVRLFQKNTVTKTATKLIVVLTALSGLSACSQIFSKGVATTETGGDRFNGVGQQAQFRMELWSPAGKVFDDQSASGVTLEKGVLYNAKIIPTGGALPETLKLEIFKTTGSGSALASLKDNFTTVKDANGKTVEYNTDLSLAAGFFSFRATAKVASAPDTVKPYDIAVKCAATDSSAFVLVGASEENPHISVSASGALNSFNYSAVGASSGGLGPYVCAWDFNGDTIVDTDFGSCSRTNIYSNHVGDRNVGVFIRDRSCGMEDLHATKTVMLAPAVGADPFLSATIAGAVGDARVNLDHLSVNPVANNPRITCNYNKSTGTFSITGVNSYEKEPRKSHGLSVAFNNVVFVDNSTINTDYAELTRVTFSTDESVDATKGQGALPQRTFQGGADKCHKVTLTAVPIFEAGAPCTSGTGTASLYTVDIKATFTCDANQLPNVNTGATDSILVTQGALSCRYVRYDGCAGGGGGGGGIDPIKF